MDRKYEFTGETKEYEGRILHRIRRPSGGVVGGWIESEYNLAHLVGCWVADEAMVFGNARVFENALVYGNTRVHGNARVCGSARVFGNAEVCEYARVWGRACVYGNALVRGIVLVCRSAKVSGHAQVFDEAEIHGNARVYGHALVCGMARVCHNARVCGCAAIKGNAHFTEQYNQTPTVLKGPIWSNVLCGPMWDVVQHPSGQVSIGCEKHPLDHWLENYRIIGVEHALTDNHIEKYGKLLRSLKAAQGELT